MGRINEGEHIIQHDGHSSYTYNMRMVNDDVGTLTNTKYCFIYSNGCMSGGFDQDDCIAEYFTAKEEHGAFAGIWNARYGWFWSYNTDGDSQRFVREFWDGVFGENIRSIGMANQDSREDNIYIINRSCIRWTYYELNLFGDPSVALRINNAPDKPAVPPTSRRHRRAPRAERRARSAATRPLPPISRATKYTTCSTGVTAARATGSVRMIPDSRSMCPIRGKSAAPTA